MSGHPRTRRLFVVSRSVPAHAGSGGMERLAWDIVLGLRDRWSVEVLTTPVPGRAESFVEDGVQVRTVPRARPGRYSLRWWLGTARDRHAQNSDVVLSI